MSNINHFVFDDRHAHIQAHREEKGVGHRSTDDDLVHRVQKSLDLADLAGDFLHSVKCPTLLIVGQLDYEVIKLNELAYEKLHCTKEISIIPNATHLFEEEGTLEQASLVARDWFIKFL